MAPISDWIVLSNPMNNPLYPFGVSNMPYNAGYKIWQILGGLIAWLIDVIVPGNRVSLWLMGDAVSNALGMILMVIVIFAVCFIVNLTMIWVERKVLGRLMDRRATMIGPLGYLQCLGDGLKTFLKEHIVPDKADHMTYMWAVSIIVGSSVLVAGMIPLSYRFFLHDYGAGLLIIFGLFAVAPLMILVAGWSQNNKYSLIGGMRGAAQMISYEIPILLVFAAVALMAGSFNINEIVRYQSENTWFIIPQIIGFVVFMVAGTAEAERIPFDLPEAEAELVEGWQTEYGGMKWGLIMLSEYFRGYVVCALGVIMFLGGWDIPFLGAETWGAELAFLLKVFLLFFIMAWTRGTLCRIRTDQILNLGWKVLLPLAILNLFVVVVLKVGGLF